MDIIGILPCAGLGERMRPFLYPKELLPVSYYRSADGKNLRPKLLIENSLEAFSISGITKCFVVIPEWKPELMRYLGNGAAHGVNVSYLYNSRHQGLADAILSGYEWCRNKITCLALPDTIFLPGNAFAILLDKMEELGADVMLGVFPTDEPQHFAPVQLDGNGKVLNIQEKPANSPINNTWGIAVWKKTFWDFLHHSAGELTPGMSISDIFDKAAESMDVYGVYFDKGSYRDVGRINNFSFLLQT